MTSQALGISAHTPTESNTLSLVGEREVLWSLPNNPLVQALAQLEVRLLNASEQLQKLRTAFCQSRCAALASRNL